MIKQINTNKITQKPLGVYLVEAGLITPEQVKVALNEQKESGKRVGNIIVERGWLEQRTIEYVMAKVVLPERQIVDKKSFSWHKNGSNSLNLLEQPDSTSQEDHEPLLVGSRQVKVDITPIKVMRVLLFVVLSLTIASLFGQFSLFLPDYPLRNVLAQLFNVDFEQSFPALYSWSALLLCSFLLAIITYLKKIESAPYFRYWGALSIIFFYLSLDEALSLHEKTMIPLRKALHASGFLYLTWVIPAAIFVVVCLVAFIPFLAALPAKTRRLFWFSGTIFVLGAMGMEILVAPFWQLQDQQQMMSLITVVLATVEEFLEMFSIVVFIYALLSYMSSYMKGVSLQVNVINSRQKY